MIHYEYEVYGKSYFKYAPKDILKNNIKQVQNIYEQAKDMDKVMQDVLFGDDYER